MNRFFAFAVLGIAPLAWGQDLSQKINVEIPAARASVALPALGKLAGVNMEPAGNLRDDVFVISAHDVTVDELMRRIAQAENGKWIQQSGIYILTRESSTSVEQERTELKERAAAISAAVAKLNAGVGKDAFTRDTATKMADQARQMTEQMMQGNGGGTVRVNGEQLVGKTPTARAIAKILASIDATKLAQVAPNQRVVFSTNPTPMQQSLSGAAANAFVNFINEQQIYTQAYNANQPQQTDGTTRMFSFNGFGTPSMGNGDPKLGLGVGLVVVQRRFGNGLSVDILAADPKLDTIAQGSYMLVLADPPVSDAKKGSEEPLKISDEAKEMAKALNGGGQGAARAGNVMVFRAAVTGGPGGDVSFSTGGDGDNIKISPELRAKVLNPEKYEPMAFVPGEAMLALGRQTSRNVVALLPDYCFGTMNRQFVGDVTPSQFLASLAPTHALVSKEDAGWLVVSPQLPASARANVVNRSALGTLLRSLDKNGLLRLNDLTTFALAQNKVPGVNDFDMGYPRLINTSAANRDMSQLAYGSYSLYKFYGSLSGPQRDAMASGRQVPFMSLSSQQIALISDMLYNAPQGPNVQLDNNNQQSRATQEIMVASAAGQGRGMPLILGGSLSAKTERTIVVPNGVTNDGFILGNSASDALAQGINSQSGATAFLDPASIAFSKSAPNIPAMSSFTPPQYDKYRMAHQFRLSLRFMFNPRVMISRSLSDAAPDENAQWGSYESLPGDFRQKVEQTAAQLKESMGKIPGRNQTPPPPQ